jgi:hypothetical protein
MPYLDVVREMGFNIDVALHNAISLCTKHRRVPRLYVGRVTTNASSLLFYPFSNSSFKLSSAGTMNDARPAASPIVSRSLALTS